MVILSRVPFPLEKGDKLRAYHQLRILARDHEVHLIALNDTSVSADAISELNTFLASVTVFRLPRLFIAYNIFKAWLQGLPLQVGYFYRCRIARKIKSIAKHLQPDHVYFQLIRTAAYARDLNFPKTIDYQDVFSAGAMRQAEKAKWYLRWILKIEHRRLLRYERNIFERFDHHTIISFPDRELIPHMDNKLIHVIPNGVDTEFFSPRAHLKDIDILFTGNMGYPPNVDACKFLIHEIMPLVWKELPSARVMLAGASPHPEVRQLQGKKVEVTGWVDDIRDCYARSQVFIAPMRIGTGLQNKILEALSMGLPCVTTPLAFSALHPDVGEFVLTGDDASRLASNLLYLLQHKESIKAKADASRTFVLQHYDWDKATQMLEALMLSSGPVTH